LGQSIVRPIITNTTTILSNNNNTIGSGVRHQLSTIPITPIIGSSVRQWSLSGSVIRHWSIVWAVHWVQYHYQSPILSNCLGHCPIITIDWVTGLSVRVTVTGLGWVIGSLGLGLGHRLGHWPSTIARQLGLPGSVLRLGLGLGLAVWVTGSVTPSVSSLGSGLGWVNRLLVIVINNTVIVCQSTVQYVTVRVRLQLGPIQLATNCSIINSWPRLVQLTILANTNNTITITGSGVRQLGLQQYNQ